MDLYHESMRMLYAAERQSRLVIKIFLYSGTTPFAIHNRQRFNTCWLFFKGIHHLCDVSKNTNKMKILENTLYKKLHLEQLPVFG